MLNLCKHFYKVWTCLHIIRNLFSYTFKFYINKQTKVPNLKLSLFAIVNFNKCIFLQSLLHSKFYFIQETFFKKLILQLQECWMITDSPRERPQNDNSMSSYSTASFCKFGSQDLKIDMFCARADTEAWILDEFKKLKYKS